MAEAARLVVDKGADLIDINFGCPVRKVAVGQQAGSRADARRNRRRRPAGSHRQGGACSGHLEDAHGLGPRQPERPALARIAEQSGIRMITVHGRTRQQFYTGTADWGFMPG